jgi:hypothetical protein
MIARAYAFGNAYQRRANTVSVLRLVSDAKHPYSAAEVLKLSLPKLVERRLNRPAVTRTQLTAANEPVESLLNQLLQIAGSQV